jgi:hypothetical protein
MLKIKVYVEPEVSEWVWDIIELFKQYDLDATVLPTEKWKSLYDALIEMIKRNCTWYVV